MPMIDELAMDCMLKRDPGETLDSAYSYVAMELEEEGIQPHTVGALLLLDSVRQAVGWERREGIGRTGA